jgi:hypothetical protein
MIKMPAVILGCLLVVSACAQKPSYRANSDLIFVGALMVFYDSEAPLSYQTLTTQEMPKDAILLGEVEGDSCQQGLSIPIFFSPTNWVSVSGAKGNGSFKKALLDIREQHPDLTGLYDVKVDIHRKSYLTIYRKECTIVIAQGFKRPPE